MRLSGTEARGGQGFCLGPELPGREAGLLVAEARLLCPDGPFSMPMGPPGCLSGPSSRTAGWGPEDCWLSIHSSISEPQPDAWVQACRRWAPCPSSLECGLWISYEVEAQAACKTLKRGRGSRVVGWSPGQPQKMGSSPALSQTTVLYPKGHLPCHCTHLLGEGLDWMPEDLMQGCRLLLTLSLSLLLFPSLSPTPSIFSLLPAP